MRWNLIEKRNIGPKKIPKWQQKKDKQQISASKEKFENSHPEVPQSWSCDGVAAVLFIYLFY